MRANSFLVWGGGIILLRRHIQYRSLAVAVAWRESVVDAGRNNQKLRRIGGKDDALRLALGRVKQPDLGRACHAKPAIPLSCVAMPCLNDACRCCSDVSLPKAVRVIRGAEYLGEPSAFV